MIRRIDEALRWFRLFYLGDTIYNHPRWCQLHWEWQQMHYERTGKWKLK